MRRTSRNRTPSCSQWSGESTSDASSGVTGRVICHQVRTRSKPEPDSHACWRSSSWNAPVSICWTSSPRAAPTALRLADGPLDEDVGAAVGDVVGQVALDDVDEQHPALGAVVDAAPGADLAVGVADDDVLAHPQAVLGDLDEHVVDTGAGPAAAVPLVGAQQVGQPGDVEAVGGVGGADLPAGGQTGIGAELGPDHQAGVALEPGVLGDHGP